METAQSKYMVSSRAARKTAAPAVACTRRSAFTLLELLTVIIIIGIMAALAYSSLMDIIFTSRAKETAQTIRTFAERALAEGKRQNKTVELKLLQNNIQYNTLNASNSPETPTISAALSSGFSASSAAPNCASASGQNLNGSAKSKPMIGLSSLDPAEGYFSACDAKGYCGAAIKLSTKNSFIACIKKGSKSTTWEAI